MTKTRTNTSRGTMGWARRRVLPRLARLCAILGLVTLGLWIGGRVLTDQYQWSQYIWWVPPVWMIGSAWAWLGLSALFALFARRLGGIFLRPVLLIACLSSSAYLFFGVWHIHRALLPYEQSDDAIRVVHWNHGGSLIDEEGWARSVLDQGTDIVLISNAKWGIERQAILDQFAPFAPDENNRWVNYSYKLHADPSHFRVEGGAIIASRFPMTRTGMVSINMPVNKENSIREQNGRGWVMFAEFDLGEADPMVIWFVDLPSDPSAWRQNTMTKASEAIESWSGRSWVMGKHVWKSTETTGSFPDPDLIIGDFNTLRGSDSIDRLAPDMTDAFGAVGSGRARSWVPKVENTLLRQPFKLADWHIDLALVGADWKPVRYDIQNTSMWGSSEHRMQTIDLNR